MLNIVHKKRKNSKKSPFNSLFNKFPPLFGQEKEVRQLVEDVQKLTRQAADQEAKQVRVANKTPTQKTHPK